METKNLVLEIVKVLDKKKAMDIVAIETEEVTIVSDYFVIASGTSNTHAKSLADDVEYEIKENLGIEPEHIEGRATGWILLDYGTVLVHIFKGLTRRMKIKSGEYEIDADTTLVAACNGRYYGGGFNPSIVAKPDDGILDIYIIKKINLITLAKLIGKYTKTGPDLQYTLGGVVRYSLYDTLVCKKVLSELLSEIY